jgi:predicted ATPase with chaperone activity
LDRIDLHVEVPIVDFRELTSDTITGECSADIRERVAAAREIQVARTLADLAGSPNIRPTDVREAIQYRSLDRKLFS